MLTPWPNPDAMLTIGAGRTASFSCVPGIESFWKSSELVELIPPIAKMLSPQLMTWFPTRTRARWEPMFRSLLTHRSSSWMSRATWFFASSERSVRRVSVALKSYSAVPRAMNLKSSGNFNRSSGVNFRYVAKKSFLL